MSKRRVEKGVVGAAILFAALGEMLANLILADGQADPQLRLSRFSPAPRASSGA